MCSGIVMEFRCCGKKTIKYLMGRCEDACDIFMGRTRFRRICKRCRRRNEEQEAAENERLPEHMEAAKAVLEYMHGERDDPRTDERLEIIQGLLTEARQAHTTRHFADYEAGRRLHPFTDDSPYIDVLRKRFDDEAQSQCGVAFAMLRPQLWEECLRRQEQLSRGRAMTFVDRTFHFQVVINGLFLPQFDVPYPIEVPQAQAEKTSQSSCSQSMAQSQDFSADSMDLCERSNLVALPSVASKWEIAREAEYNMYGYHTISSFVSVNQSFDDDFIERGEYMSFTEWYNAHRYMGNNSISLSKSAELELDMDRYEHEYLEINEGCAPMLEDFRNLRRVIRNRPWGFYPSAVSGSRRQTLPLSAWLCVQFGYASPIDQPDKYDQAIISYTEYLKEVATPDQWKDFQSTLDQKAERDRVALYFERMDYAECDYDIVLPSVASIPWTLFTQDQQQLFWFLDRIQSNDPRFAVPSSYSYAATTIEELQREAIFLRRQRLAQGIPEPVEENILLCPDCWNLASECNGSCAVSEVNVASRPQSRGQCTVTLEEVHESDNNGGWALDANDFLPTGANAVEVSPHRMNHYANSECSTIRAGFTGFMDNGEQAADGSSSPTIRATGAEPEQRPQDGDAHIDLYEVGGNPLRFAIGPDGKPTLVRDPSGPLRVIGHEDGLLSLELDLEPESDDEDNFHSRRHRVC